MAPIITNISILDGSGNSTQSAVTGSKLAISSTITYNDISSPHAHIVQVKDAADRVVFIAVSTINIGPAKPAKVIISWNPESEGAHTVQVFAWPNVESPSYFSFAKTQVMVLAAEVDAECTGTAACLNGIVTRVVDGDTIDVNGTRVRLSLVDTPEIGEHGYEKATAFTRSICPEGSHAVVDEDDGQRSGSFGRMVGKVYCVGGMINQNLLDSQNAVVLAEFCATSEFGREEWAKGYGC
jgi:endonuclease YncB( thermonuclease family)